MESDAVGEKKSPAMVILSSVKVIILTLLTKACLELKHSSKTKKERKDFHSFFNAHKLIRNKKSLSSENCFVRGKDQECNLKLIYNSSWR